MPLLFFVALLIFQKVVVGQVRTVRTADQRTFMLLADYIQTSSPPALNSTICPKDLPNPNVTDFACDAEGFITHVSFVSQVSVIGITFSCFFQKKKKNKIFYIRPTFCEKPQIFLPISMGSLE